MPTNGKLTEEDKAEMKRLREAGMAEYKIAARFGVAPGTVRWALGKRWKRKDKLAELDTQKFMAMLFAARGRTDKVVDALGVDTDTIMDWMAGVVAR